MVVILQSDLSVFVTVIPLWYMDYMEGASTGPSVIYYMFNLKQNPKFRSNYYDYHTARSRVLV